MEGKAPKTFGIKMKDLIDHNPTKGCPGCAAQISGKTRQKHTENCRKRFEGLLKEDPRVKAAKLRADEFVSKAIERSC